MIYKKSWKYILIRDDSYWCNCYCNIYHIKAVKDFSDISFGDIGGYLEGYYNLSQTGNCWVYDNVLVRDYARVSENATMSNYARAYDNAHIYGNAKVAGSSIVISGDTQVYNDILYTDLD